PGPPHQTLPFFFTPPGIASPDRRPAKAGRFFFGIDGFAPGVGLSCPDCGPKGHSALSSIVNAKADSKESALRPAVETNRRDVPTICRRTSPPSIVLIVRSSPAESPLQSPPPRF